MCHFMAVQTSGTNACHVAVHRSISTVHGDRRSVTCVSQGTDALHDIDINALRAKGIDCRYRPTVQCKTERG
jgi:hypothetical protein